MPIHSISKFPALAPSLRTKICFSLQGKQELQKSVFPHGLAYDIKIGFLTSKIGI